MLVRMHRIVGMAVPVLVRVAMAAQMAVPVLVLHTLFYKELLFVSFDRETARTLGYNVRRWDLLLYLTLGVVIASAMQFAGVMLVFNFLVLPAVTGLLLSHTMRGLFFWSVTSALVAAVVGFSLSVPFDLPSGPTISAVSGAFVLLAWAGRRMDRAIAGALAGRAVGVVATEVEGASGVDAQVEAHKRAKEERGQGPR